MPSITHCHYGTMGGVMAFIDLGGYFQQSRGGFI